GGTCGPGRRPPGGTRPPHRRPYGRPQARAQPLETSEVSADFGGRDTVGRGLMKPAIRVESLSKLYHIGSLQEGPQTLKAALAHNLAEPWRRLQKRFRKAPAAADGNGTAEPDTIWALPAA